MNNVCTSCGGKCCQGIIEVSPSDAIFNDRRLTTDAFGLRAMQLNGFNCIALKNGKCSIYDKRPRVCRDFEVGCQRCENYRTGKLNAHLDSICSLGDALAKATKL